MKIKLVLSLLSCIVTINYVYTQEIKVPPPATEKKTGANTSSNEQSSANKLTLKINPNLSCKILIDGEDKGIINADGIKKVNLSKGTFLIQAISTENADVKFQEEYLVTEVNIEKLYKIDLIKLRDSKVVKKTEQVPVKEKVSETIVDTKIYDVVDEPPTYIGKNETYQQFIANNLKYPQTAKENGIMGTVYISFVVDEKGKITDVKLVRGIGGGCDEEAIRVVNLMPAWNPGKQSGKAVKVKFNMPIRFTLN